MLEHQIQVEKSEKLVLMSEVSHIDRHIAKQSSKMSMKFSQRMTSKISSYHKNMQSRHDEILNSHQKSV